MPNDLLEYIRREAEANYRPLSKQIEMMLRQAKALAAAGEMSVKMDIIEAADKPTAEPAE